MTAKLTLSRLRDVSADAERDFKSKIADMERELSLNEDVIGQLLAPRQCQGPKS